MAKNESIKAIILNEQIDKLPYSYKCEEKKAILAQLKFNKDFNKDKDYISRCPAGELINRVNFDTGNRIAPVKLRKHIQEIRERAAMWLPKGTWLVANSKGYWLTDDVKVADKYFKGVWTRKQSAQAQHLNYQVIKDEIKRGKK